MDILNQAPEKDKEEIFHLVYNCTLYIFDYCRVLRKSTYGIASIKYLKYCLVALESNIILLSVKYLEWRTKIYIELSHIYEENGSVKCAMELIRRAEEKILAQFELEKKDPPVPKYMENIYMGCLRSFKALKLKFGVQVTKIFFHFFKYFDLY